MSALLTDWRRHLVWAGWGLVAAVVTGPQGTGDDATAALRGALALPRSLLFALGGVLLGIVVAAVGRRREAGAVAPPRWSRRVADPAHRRALVVLMFVALVVLPLLLPAFWQRVLVDQIGIFVLLAIGLNVVVGWAGLLDLGDVAFFAIGAYSTAYLTGALPVQPPFTLDPLLCIPFAILAAMVAGALLGWPTLRLRGDYLAIVTLGFGEIVRLVLVNADDVTNGPRGAYGIPHFSLEGLGLDLSLGLDSLPWYYVMLVVLAVVVVAFSRLEHSRLGRGWAAIREDEIAAAATGIPTVRYKLLAFTIGASTAGLAGVLYASKVGYINPDNFPLMLSILVLAMVILGGLGSIPGVILGTALFGFVPNALRDVVPPEDRFLYVGAILMIMMVFRPQGLWPSRRRSREIQLAEQGVGAADSLGPSESFGPPATAPGGDR